MSNKTCTICGDPIKYAVGPSNKYCPVCKNQVIKKRSLKRSAVARAIRERNVEARKCVFCTKIFIPTGKETHCPICIKIPSNTRIRIRRRFKD